MDAREFLPIAERMSTSANEAERRTSIGRSYYGLFHVLLGALSDRGVIFRETSRSSPESDCLPDKRAK